MQAQSMQDFKWSVEDAASLAAVIVMLEDQAAKLGATSKAAGIWRDWADLLRPTAVEMGAQV